MTQIDKYNFQKKVLITPLNWGLGHASRCVPIISTLEQFGAEVTVAADGMALRFLKKSFPHLPTIVLPDVQIEYAKHHQQWLQLLFKYPELNKQIKSEHKNLDQIVHNHDIDLIISDNRYGCFHKNTPSIILTHQLTPKVPVLGAFAKKKVSSLLKNFDQIWVPDFADEIDCLAGELCHPGSDKITYIGPQSQFNAHDDSQATKDIAILLSGPEPQRSKLEKKLSVFMADKQLSGYLIRGTDSKYDMPKPGLLEVIDLAYGHDLYNKLSDCQKIIARGGYSTMMDMYILNKHALLIPTKGQPEQEYLAKFHRSGHHFHFADQTDSHLFDKLESFIAKPLGKLSTKKRSDHESLLYNALQRINT